MKKLLFLSVVLVLLASCSTAYKTVYTDYDRSADFSQYKTFAWLPDKGDTTNTQYNNEIIRNNIRNYLGQCLSDRAYSFNAENPDLLFQLSITNAKKERVVTTSNSGLNYFRPYYFGSIYYNPYHSNYYYNYYPTYAPYSYGSRYTNTQKVEYVNGAITLNVIDKKINKLIWTGTAEGDIYDGSMISKNIHPAVHNVIAQYPIKPLIKEGHRIKE